MQDRIYKCMNDTILDTSNLNKRIGRNLKNLRVLSNFTQTEVAKDMGYATSMISELENGKKDVKVEMLMRLANYYRVSIDDIIYQNIALSHSERPVKYCNEYDFTDIAYKKYDKVYYLYRNRTKVEHIKDILECTITIDVDKNAGLYRVSGSYSNNLPNQSSEYKGTLVISGQYTYIYLSGDKKDRALIIIPDPRSNNTYIGGIGTMLCISEGYEHAAPCVQNVILSKKRFYKDEYPYFKELLRLPKCHSDSIIRFDRDIDNTVYKFLKGHQI